MTLPHIEKLVRKHQEEGKTREEISRILGISVYQVRKILDPDYTTKLKQQRTKREGVELDAANGVEPAPRQKPDWNEWAAHLKTLQQFRGIDPTAPKDEVSVTFTDGLPVGISVFSDIHCGDAGVRYDLLDQHVQIVKKTDGMYCVFNGDELNNFLGSLSHAGRHDLVQNDQQWQIVESLLDELQESILTITMGNHNAWTGRHAGFNYQHKINSKFNLVDIGDGAKLYISVGDQLYVWMLRHKYRSESAMNSGHAVMKMHDEFGPFDIGCIGHVHVAAIGWQMKQGHKVGYIRPGSYKILDHYAEELGFPRSVPMSPTVILFPDKKEFKLYDNIEEAAEDLSIYRERYRRRLEAEA